MPVVKHSAITSATVTYWWRNIAWLMADCCPGVPCWIVNRDAINKQQKKIYPGVNRVRARLWLQHHINNQVCLLSLWGSKQSCPCKTLDSATCLSIDQSQEQYASLTYSYQMNTLDLSGSHNIKYGAVPLIYFSTENWHNLWIYLNPSSFIVCLWLNHHLISFFFWTLFNFKNLMFWICVLETNTSRILFGDWKM